MTIKSRIEKLETAKPNNGHRYHPAVRMIEQDVNHPGRYIRDDGQRGTEAELIADLPAGVPPHISLIVVEKMREEIRL
jgi:hypothetical protein